MVDRVGQQLGNYHHNLPAQSTTLIGRKQEVAAVCTHLQHPEIRLVTLTGPGGVGKSRLVTELENRLRGESLDRLRYFCSPNHQDSALFPFVDQLRRAAGFVSEDSPAVRLEKLEALLGGAVPPDEDVAFLADLLSLPPSQRHPLPALSPQITRIRLRTSCGGWRILAAS